MNAELIKEIQEKLKSYNVCNVGIFIDFDNIFYTLKDYGVNFEEDNECIFSLINSIYGKERIRTLRAYADFDQVKMSLRKLQTKRVQIRNVYGNGKSEENRKNASDIELCIDAIETYYKDSSIDTFVFFTSDSDMIPIMSRLVYKGKQVHLYYVNGHTSQYAETVDYTDFSYDLLKLLEIDENRAAPEFWKDKALNVIDAWHNQLKNRGKNLGGSWLNTELQNNIFVSTSLASKIMGYLTTEGYVIEENYSYKNIGNIKQADALKILADWYASPDNNGKKMDKNSYVLALSQGLVVSNSIAEHIVDYLLSNSNLKKEENGGNIFIVNA